MTSSVIDLSSSSPPPILARKNPLTNMSLALTENHPKLPAHDHVEVITDSDFDSRPGPSRQGSKKAAPLSNSSRPSNSDVELITPTGGPCVDVPVSPPFDPLDELLAGVLEIIPDVQPAHARSLLEQLYPVHGPAVQEHVLETLFEGSYPKVQAKGKGKRKRDEQDGSHAQEDKKVRIDYASTQRPRSGGPGYDELALYHLCMDFAFVPKPHVRKIFLYNNSLYAPTHLMLDVQSRSENPPFKQKNIPTRVTGKQSTPDVEFDREREWLLLHLNANSQPQHEITDDPPEGEGIECGCCFSDFSFDKMVQCPEAHLFCRDCCIRYASELLGSRNSNLTCMDQSGCKAPFPESELTRFLPDKLLALYHRVKQESEIKLACLDGLEECPFCDYKVVIENPDERLFRCEDEDCGIVSCRQCKKEDHLPKTCQEAEEDKHLDGRHAIEEAMTAALMRNCPKCHKAFIKQDGCNKMRCPDCQTLSCYVCRKVISGYDHFGEQTPYRQAVDKTKCPLWDSVEKRHSDEVTAAAKKAMEDYKKSNPGVDDKEIAVDLPPVPLQPPQPPNQYRPQHPPPPPRHMPIHPPRPAHDPWDRPIFNPHVVVNQQPVPIPPDPFIAGLPLPYPNHHHPPPYVPPHHPHPVPRRQRRRRG